jgi:hypothetical protein
VTTTVSAINTSSAILDGGAGNDFLQGTIAADVLNGGEGTTPPPSPTRSTAARPPA